MSKQPRHLDADTAYLLLWRVVHLTVHRYDNPPTGELLTVIVIKLLDEFGYQSTLSELAALVDLPKSTVSRYVSALMDDGFLEEYIDPADRRRRRLRCTRAAEIERDWHLAQVMSIWERTLALVPEPFFDSSSGSSLVDLLRSFASEKPLEYRDGVPQVRPPERVNVQLLGPESDAGMIYAILWRFIDHVVHRYGSQPCGELLVALSMVLLDMADYHPTAAELAEIIGLRKSTVSRYCSVHISAGFLEEYVDADDRRLRRLRLSSQARDERVRAKEQFIALKSHATETLAGLKLPADFDRDQILAIMRDFVAGRSPERYASG